MFQSWCRDLKNNTSILASAMRNSLENKYLCARVNSILLFGGWVQQKYIVLEFFIQFSRFQTNILIRLFNAPLAHVMKTSWKLKYPLCVKHARWRTKYQF